MMTKEELIFMIQSIAGVHFDHEGVVSLHARDIQGIVNVGIRMGAAAEREACARLCEGDAELLRVGTPPQIALMEAAAAIRARGQG